MENVIRRYAWKSRLSMCATPTSWILAPRFSGCRASSNPVCWLRLMAVYIKGTELWVAPWQRCIKSKWQGMAQMANRWLLLLLNLCWPAATDFFVKKARVFVWLHEFLDICCQGFITHRIRGTATFTYIYHKSQRKNVGIWSKFSDLTWPHGGLVREILLTQGISGWWIIN